MTVRDKMEQKRQGQAECIERESLAKQEVDMRTLEMQRVQQGADMHLVRVSNKDHEVRNRGGPAGWALCVTVFSSSLGGG